MIQSRLKKEAVHDTSLAYATLPLGKYKVEMATKQSAPNWGTADRACGLKDEETFWEGAGNHSPVYV